MADISKITIPNGNSTSTYDLKDSNAIHNGEDFKTKTITPISGLETYQASTLGATNLTSVGTVTINNASVTKYKLNLTGVLNSLTATAQTAATIDGLTNAGQEVLTGLTKEVILYAH